MSTTTPPPVGLAPKFIRDEQRLNEIYEAMQRYLKAFVPIPPEWLDEVIEITERLKERKTTREVREPFRKPFTERLEALEKVVSDHLAEHRYIKTMVGTGYNSNVNAVGPDESSPSGRFVVGLDKPEAVTSVVTGEDQSWSIYIDLGASPKGVGFEVALAFLRAGRRVARRAGGWDVSATTNVLVDHLRTDGPMVLKYHYRTDTATIWTPNPHDLLGKDWEVIPEP